MCTQNFENVTDDSKELPVQDTLGVSLLTSDFVAGFETFMSFHQLESFLHFQQNESQKDCKQHWQNYCKNNG